MGTDAAAAHFGVEVGPPIGGWTNEHWLARRGDEQLVLGRFRERVTLQSSRYEAELLRRLSAAGHPVPRVAADPVQIEGRVWTLTSKLEGLSGGYETDDPSARGRLLAELHRDLASASDLGQRDSWHLMDAIVATDGLDDALRYYATLFPADAAVMAWHLERTRALLAEHDLSALPTTVIHGDFTPWNLLFVDGAVTGILDFDFAHLDYRVADFALSWRGKYDDVVHGFNDISPLSDAEWQLLTPVRWAWLFIGVEDSINDIRSGREAPSRFLWTVPQLLRRSPLMRVDPYPA